ncbi:MAG: thiamine phosphate synthase [Candidatus Thiodiazotropha sp. (ex Dulcina madagascariensis)]|nr:thiamine phosphate synthase [Candidatus Thiodiazotropha sp. (ex Dulcina madagascariensis)]MCU7926669.1 thiamine phosphate synthase [Candidatus Thiodiazotropha sp. (ex Dulcina madagascariensis)]
MNSPPSLRGLYAITDTLLCPPESLLRQVEKALRGGARVIQYRDKSNDQQRRRSEAGALQRLCREHGALLLINDDVELAEQSGADGVHLGREDVGLALARARLGADAVIGISCYNSLELAHRASAAGADYIAFGRFFPSRTKPDAVQADPGLLQHAKSRFDLPLVAIGGITPENGARLIAAGADMLALIHGIFAQPDIEAASRKISRLFKPEEKQT